MKNEAEKQQNPDIKEVKIGLSLVDSILNRAIFNHCSIVLFDKSNPEKFDHEVKELASKHANTATIYKDLEGNVIMASDLYFNPYSVKTIASVQKEFKEQVVDLLEGMGFEMRGKQYHISDISYDRNEEEIRVEYENLTEGTEHSKSFSSFYYWLTNNEAETMSQFDFKELKDLWTEISAKEEEQENFKNQPEYGTNKGILKVLGENQDEIKEIRTDYSGRGMYGVECFGIVVEPYSNIEDELEKYDVMGRKDNMGHDYIIYWPSLTYEELKSEDTNGILRGFDISEGSVDTIKELKRIAEYSGALPLCVHDEYNGEVYYIHEVDGLTLKGTIAEDSNGYSVSEVLSKLPENGEVKVEFGDVKYPVLFINDSNKGRVELHIESEPDFSEDYDDEGNLLHTAEADYALKPMVEELESKGFKVIDEGSSDEVTVYVYNTDEEFTEDIFLALIFGSTGDGNYAHVDTVDSNFKSLYPTKYKEIEEIAKNHEKSDEKSEAVRMESLADAGDCYKIIKQPLDVSATSFAEQVVFEALESAGGEACESEIKKIIDDQSLWGYYQKSNPGTLRRARENPELIKNGLEELIKDGYVALSDGKSMADKKPDIQSNGLVFKFKYHHMSKDRYESGTSSPGDFALNVPTEPGMDHSLHLIVGPRRGTGYISGKSVDEVVKKGIEKWGTKESPKDAHGKSWVGWDVVKSALSKVGVSKEMFKRAHQEDCILEGIKLNEEKLLKLLSKSEGYKIIGFEIDKGWPVIDHGDSGDVSVITEDRFVQRGWTEALHPEQKGGQEIKLRKIADKHIDEIAKHAHTGIVQHAILDPNTSDLNKEQILSVRKALVEVGNRNMGHDRVRKEGKEGVIAGSDIAEFASWITSDCMALTADYLNDNIDDRNAQETYTFAKSKLEDCLMDFYRTETNRSNYPEIYAFWEDLIYGQKAFGASEEVDFFTVYLMKEKTEEGVQFLCDLVSEAFDTTCTVVDNSAFNVYRKGKLKGNEKAELQVSNLVGQSEILEIA